MLEPAGWFPVFTLILGYVTKALSDWIQHRRTLERERETRPEIRQDVATDRRIQFQRQTLLDLQEAAMGLARNTGSMNHLDVMGHRTAGIWHGQRYPDDLNENHALATARTSMLVVRVDDAEVRELADAFKTSASEATLSKTAANADSWMMKMAKSFDELQQRIGIVLRELNQDESKAQELTANQKG